MALVQPTEPDVSAGRPWERVVVGVDDSSGGVAALRRAVSLARTNEAPLVAVRAWALGLPEHGGRRHRHDGHLVVLVFRGAERREAAAKLVRQTFRAAMGGIPHDLAVRIETPEGDPGTVLTQLARNPGDVLVVGTQRGHALKRLMHGSVSRYCSSRSSCPVVVVQPGQPTGIGDHREPATVS